MKRIALLILVAMAAASSCTKELSGAVDKAEGTVNFTVRAELPDYDEATKSTLVNTVRVKWEDHDVIYVYDHTKCLGTLEASVTDPEGKVAYLSGEIAASGASMLTLVSMTTDITPSVSTKGALIENGVTFDLSNQALSGTPYVAFATVPNTGISNISASFSFATSVVRVNCTGLKASADIDSVIIQGVNTKFTISPKADDVPVVTEKKGSGTVIRKEPSAKASASGLMVFSVALRDPNAAPRRISAVQGNNVNEAKFTGAALAPGTSYNTICQLNRIPDDALLGVFSVSATKQVHFSKGNLYAKKTGDNWTWNFYDGQYKYNSLSTSSSRTADANDTEIDLFTWGYDNTSTNASYSLNPVNTAGISGHTTDGDKQFSSSEDWGYVFGGESSVWRTLTLAEWKYLFAWTESGSNTDTSSPRYNLHKYAVTVCGKTNCVVLLPDNWDGTVISLESFTAQNSYNESSTPKWSEMQAAGAVCLPAAGSRNSSNVFSVGESGYYWSSTADVNGSACYVLFNSSKVDPTLVPKRSNGFSVRLITDVK